MSPKVFTFLATAAFAVLLSGVASARRPPALAEQQDAATKVLSRCPAPTTDGYRDMLARSPARANEPAVVRLAARRKMADHSVIVCAGEAVHTGGGYRDVFVRLPQEPAAPMVALGNR